MTKIMFVCLGNICRSPMAEMIFKDIIKLEGRYDDFIVNSSATSSEEIGNSIYAMAREKMLEKDINIEKHIATKFNKEDYYNYDYIIGMDDGNVRDILKIIGNDTYGKVYKLLHFTGMESNVEDPWYTRDFERAFEDISEGCKALYEYVR